MRLAILLPFIAACAPAFASETTPVDFRFNLVLAPPTDDVKATYSFPDNTGGSVTEDHLNEGARFEVGLAMRLATLSDRWTLVGGAMAFYGDQESSEFEPGDRAVGFMAGPMGMTTLGINLFIAASVRVNPYFSAEFGPFVGVGTAKITDHALNIAGSITEEDGSGDYEEAGLSLSISTHNSVRSFLVSLGVRYYIAYTEADLKYDVVRLSDMQEFPNGMNQHLEIRQSGFAPYLTVGLTF